ncbi:cardiolipin synthase [Neotamlana laminarinivorans]|uniref:Cardiolipin synthase n=1 Tax=Neotamlana laminarinivorans TaxID=2883124 RepID=A0A9X1I0M3_9FLAO|nr:cardiolipin synthase [Tamlana laminarinivorans]MCB4798755.1 cardiolipin synthase [Tamlana laminarinivorans]
MFKFIGNNIWLFLIILNYVIAVSAVITVILKNLNPTKTLSYIVVLVFFPFLGPLVYYLFGQEYRKNKIFNRKYVLNKAVIKAVKKEQAFSKQQLQKVNNYLDEKVKLVKLLHSNQNEPLTLRNNIDILKNGDDKFKKLFADIKQAKHHINIEYYIIKDDVIGSKLLNLLCEKAKEGVIVRMSYDDVGSKISNKMKSKLTHCGIKHHAFMPVLLPKFTGKMNYRNHRKIAIIDGEIGYVGGINIGDEYVNANNKTFWRDTHLRIQGEAVRSLQIHFLSTWHFVSNERIDDFKLFFPDLEETNKNDVGLQIAASGPDTDWANIMELTLTAIITASDYVYITTPYFVPNDEMIKALQIASKSGVDVRLLIPEKSDSWVVKHASNSYLEGLFKAGIKVYKYQKGFIHAKTMVVDDVFAMVGTSNMDYRSFNINFEINSVIYDKVKAKELKSHFQQDLEDSKVVNPEVYIKRSKFDKLKESYCRLWSPLI